MKKIIFLLLLLIPFGNIFAQIKGIQRIGSTTLRDSSGQLTIDNEIRVMGQAHFQEMVTAEGIGTFGSLNAAHYYINDESFSDIFGKLSAPNEWYRAQNFDTLSFTNSFSLNSGSVQLLEVTPAGDWLADHYDFYTKGVKRLSIDGDSNKIKIYSGSNQISLWNNNGVLEINAPIVSTGGLETGELDVMKTLNISGVIKSVGMQILNDTLFADSGMVFTKTLSAHTSFKIAGLNDGQEIIVAVTNTAANYTAAWIPSGSLNLYWPNNITPTQTTGAHVDIYTFRRIGNDIFGSVVQNYK